MLELSKTENEILKWLSKKGELTDYELSVKNKVAAHSTIWKALKKLRKIDLVEISHEKKFARIPSQTIKYYGLTFRGIIATLKIKGITIANTKNFNNLFSKWMNKTYALAKSDDAAALMNDGLCLKDHFGAYLKTTDAELFLRHFDLEYSDNALIYQLLVWRVLCFVTVKNAQAQTPE